jgi:hypothetical protein
MFEVPFYFNGIDFDRPGVLGVGGIIKLYGGLCYMLK